MIKREFVFELKEIKSRYNPNFKDNREDYVSFTTGIVQVREDEITVMVDDKQQPYGMFEVKDNLFKRIMKKIHGETK